MLFSSQKRSEYLDLIVTYLKNKGYIEGIILVGSGANGFPDDYADIDLSIVVYPSNKTYPTWQNFNKYVSDKMDLFHLATSEYGENNYLTLLFTHDFLEIDVGFISLDELVARKAYWQILYEKGSSVSERMKDSWAKKESIDVYTFVERGKSTFLYHTRNACVALRRSRLFRAIHEIECLRNLVVKIWGTSTELTTKHYRDVDSFDSDFLEKLKGSYPNEMSKDSVEESFKKVVDFYFYALVRAMIDEEFIKNMRSYADQMMYAYGLRLSNPRY